MNFFKPAFSLALLFANISILSSSCPPEGCGTIPYPTDYNTPEPIIDSPEVWSFISEPDLHPMKMTVNTFQPGTSSGFVFLAPYGFSSDATYGQSGSLIVDNTGNPIWFRPLSSPNLMNTDFRVQTLSWKAGSYLLARYFSDTSSLYEYSRRFFRDRFLLLHP